MSRAVNAVFPREHSQNSKVAKLKVSSGIRCSPRQDLSDESQAEKLDACENQQCHSKPRALLVSVDNELLHGRILLSFAAGLEIEYLAASSSPSAAQNKLRILRMTARETPSLPG